MTSHARLAEVMHMPCTCGHGQNHAKCEGNLAGTSAFYTPSYVRRVARAVGQQMSREGLVLESWKGETSLQARFFRLTGVLRVYLLHIKLLQLAQELTHILSKCGLGLNMIPTTGAAGAAAGLVLPRTWAARAMMAAV